jgi:hypothetical protein
MPGPGYFARLGVDAEVDPEALPIEQRSSTTAWPSSRSC